LLEAVALITGKQAAAPAAATPAAPAQTPDATPGTPQAAPETPKPVAVKPETPAAPEAPATPAPEGPPSRGWAAVKEQEKQLREVRARLEADRQAIDAARRQLEEQRRGAVDWQAELKRDPFGTLARAGMPFEAIADMAISGQTAPAAPTDKTAPAPTAAPADPEKVALMQRVEQLEQRQRDQSIRDYQWELGQKLATDPKYRLIKSYPGIEQEAVRLAAAYAQQRREFLTPEKALDMLDGAYREQLQSLRSHEAVREVLGLPAPTAPAPVPSAPAPTPAASPTPKPAARTVTQDLAASTPVPRSEVQPTFLSEHEVLTDAAKYVLPGAFFNS
jgi:hypothetical protein